MRLPAVITAAAMLSGCATILEDESKPVSIRTNPAGASFTITDREGKIISSGRTPQQVTLRNGAGYFKQGIYQINVSKEGYDDAAAELSPGISGWYFGNILFGGLIGMLAVDPASGAMYKLPDSTTIPMRKKDVLAVAAADTTQSSEKVSGAADRQAQLDQLMVSGVSYEEYQRRYREIMGQ